VLEKRARERVEPRTVLGEQGEDFALRFGHDAADLLVDDPLGLRRCVRGAGQEWPDCVAWDHRDRSQRFTHAPAADHQPREAGQLLDVRLGAGADLAEDDLLGNASPEGDPDLGEDLRLQVVEAIGVGSGERDPQSHAARDD
jgi:hypothetical protein